MKLFRSTINQQMYLYNFHSKHFKTLKTTPTCFDLFRSSSRRSLLKLLHIHDLLRFCKQAVVAAYHMLGIRRTLSQLHSLQQIPTQYDMLPQHLVYINEVNREYVITLARNDETP